ncbi:MAG: tRNA 2-selenouridine(34) synthase MnmH [Bacteroidia bacterium]|nr:tRNA 2-selenouridine(34) synthase MnmH [Bacteroidia bacterium]
MKLPQYLSPGYFYEQSAGKVILDVRSPGEFAQGHISGAISFPLFSDEERAIVGTLYKERGKEAALLKGLEFVGVKMAELVKQALRLSKDRELYLYCWRGGMRSGSVAQLLAYTGIPVKVLEGGYKAYRQFVLEYFTQHEYQLLILGGKTGSGKTDVLKSLREKGEQVIDLEHFANHRGSAFGNVMLPPQPRSEHFENLIFSELYKMNPQKPIWVESESRTIGSVFIPEGFWNKMLTAPLLIIEVPESVRISRLVKEYSTADKEMILESLSKIERKLGGVAFQQAKEAYEKEDLSLATSLVLKYYDKTYHHSTSLRKPVSLTSLTFSEESVPEIADALILALSKLKNSV